MKLFRVNYNALLNDDTLRSKTTVVRAEDAKSALVEACGKIKEQYTTFQVTSVKEFKNDAPQPDPNQVDAFDPKKNPPPSKAR